MRKLFAISLLLLTGSTLAACETKTTTNTATTTASSTPVAIVTGSSTPLAVLRSVTDTKTVENKDGSTTVVTSYSDGSKTEERTFKTGRLTKVTRETPAGGGTRTARVVYRDDNSEVAVDDPSWVEKSMNATSDALAVAARKTKAGIKEIGDKAEDVGDATKKGVKKGANEAADKAEDAGDLIKKGAREVADKAEDVGDATKKGAKKAGKAVKDAVTPDKKHQ